LCTTEPAEQLWSREFELAEQDLEGWAAILLDAIGPELRGRYGVDVSQVNIPAESVHSPEAYRTFLIGRYFWYRENSNPGRALELYRKAVSLAPRFAAPYAGLVDCYCTYGLWQMMPQAEARRRALRSAEQAISLAPDNPDSQFSHGYAQFYARWHWAEAEAVFRHLLRRQPEHISGNSFLGLLLAALGRDDEAEALGERLVALDPASPWCWFIRGQCAWFRRDFECQAESGLQGLTLSANDPLLLYVAAKGLALSGEFQQANALTEQLERIAGQVDIFLAIAATTRGHCGEMDRARAQCTELENRAKQHPVSPMLFGLVYAILGRRDEALDALEAAYRECNMMLWIIACDPVFDELRGERRFRDLVQAMDLPDASPAG
jgi:tetratricopeptide (TPR) repeat protein